MRKAIYLIIIIVSVLNGCTRSGGDKVVAREEDSNYTWQAAMGIYAYQPVRSLQILDSAVIVGNLSPWRADMCRARIYSMSLMKDQLDSLLGGSQDVRLDSARIISERLLSHDSVKSNLILKKDVLEVLVNAERMDNDTVGWMQRLSELVDVCRKIGPKAETDALRTEAEIGAALCALGQYEQGMAKMDSVIDQLNASFHREHDRGTFDKLDALIIALKRKLLILGSRNQYAETLPLAHSIIEQLDDYEAHPDDYHDGSHREPKTDQRRADYIRFYRNQAQNYITAAYSSLGEHGNMLTAFRQIEKSVQEATAREHIARYNALQQQMEVERQQAKASRASLIAIAISIVALMVFAFAVVVIWKNRVISRKNGILVQQIADAMNYKKLYMEEKQTHEPEPVATDLDLSTLTDEQLFQHINKVIVREKLFLNPKFERQTIMDRFDLSKERVGAVFSKGSDYTKLSNYIQQLRLEYAAKLLVEQPEMSIVQIAAECGFGSHKYFSERFRLYFSMTPSEFRKASQQSENPSDDATDEAC